jgi:hypothetical protein
MYFGSLAMRLAIVWIVTIASTVALQILLFVELYWLRTDANITNPGAAHWYRKYVSSDLALFGSGPIITFFVIATICVILHWPKTDFQSDGFHAAIVTVGVTIASLPTACTIAFNLWGT